MQDKTATQIVTFSDCESGHAFATLIVFSPRFRGSNDGADEAQLMRQQIEGAEAVRAHLKELAIADAMLAKCPICGTPSTFEVGPELDKPTRQRIGSWVAGDMSPDTDAAGEPIIHYPSLD